MVRLREFVENIQNDNLKYEYPVYFGYTFDDFLEANSVTEETVTEDMIDWYVKHICDKRTFSHPAIFSNDCMQIDNYVNEMLNTTSINLLVKRLNVELGATKTHSVSIIDSDKLETSSSKDVQFLSVPKKLYDIEKISKICDKLMWQPTSVKTGLLTSSNPMNKHVTPFFSKYGSKVFATELMVEPLKPEKRTHYVQDYCDGIIYHLCEKSALNSIMKSGLRMKGENNSYRFIKNRIYFICAKEKEDLKNTILRVARTKGYYAGGGKLSDDIVLLKIDVSDYNIDFYMDKMYNSDIEDFVVYAFGYIPPKMIEVLDFDKEFAD